MRLQSVDLFGLPGDDVVLNRVVGGRGGGEEEPVREVTSTGRCEGDIYAVVNTVFSYDVNSQDMLGM